MNTIQTFGPGEPLYADFITFAETLNHDDKCWRAPEDPTGGMSPNCYLLRSGDRVLARACTVVNPLLSYREQKTALIGWYEAVDDTGVAIELFEFILSDLRADGFTYVIGPMNLSTWHQYRCAQPTPESGFFLDVCNKPWYAEQWRAAGFTSIAEYYSTKFVEIERDYHDLRPLQSKLSAAAITLRTLRLDDFDGELQRIYTLSTSGFSDNFLYTPIDFKTFADMYQKVRQLIDADFVLIAENAESLPIGFAFAINNVFVPGNSSLVMKSAAVLPEYAGIGLGHFMLESIHHTAQRKGYTEIIHALMIATNRSMKIMSDRARPYRIYSLFGRTV